MRTLLGILLCYLPLLGISQSVILAGYITDSQTKTPIPKASILVDESTKGTTSKENGYFRIKFKTPEKVTISLSHLGYEPATKTIDLAKAKDTLWLNVALRAKTHIINTFEISAESKPEVVHGTQEYSISDFEFHKDDLLLLTYEKNIKKDREVIWIDKNQKEISSIRIPITVEELYKDYRDRIYVIGEETVFQINFDRSRLSLTKLPFDDFKAILQPCIDTLYKSIAFTVYQWFYPILNYYFYNPTAMTSTKVYEVKDEELYHLYRMQYYFMHPKDKVRARNLAYEYKMEKQDIAALMTGFTNTLYYEPLYAPLFVVNDTALVFDHYSNQIVKIDEYGSKVDSTDISYHQTNDEKWKKMLVKDEITDDIYSVHATNGHLSLNRINTSSGDIDNNFKLKHRYVENIEIKNGYAYYIYRPYESMQKKYLYRELIKEN